MKTNIKVGQIRKWNGDNQYLYYYFIVTDMINDHYCKIKYMENGTESHHDVGLLSAVTTLVSNE